MAQQRKPASSFDRGWAASSSQSGEDRIYYTRAPQGQMLSMLRDLSSRSGDYYPLTDHLGTTVALTDSNGGLTTRYCYEPYGQQIGTPSGPAMPWRFAGQYLDTETSLYKMGLRYYDPGTMRWTQKDPLNLFQDPKQGNRYSYAGSDPVNNVDPSGRSIFDGISNPSCAIDIFDTCDDLGRSTSTEIEAVVEETSQFAVGCAGGATFVFRSQFGQWLPPPGRAVAVASGCIAGGGVTANAAG